MDDLCTACLCTGRNLYFIGETGSYHLYSQILNEIPVYDFSDVCVRVCWECRALLRRFREFKALVKRSYTELLQQLHQNIPPCKSSLARAPRLQAAAPEAFAWPHADACVKREEGEGEGELLTEQIEDIKPLKEEQPEEVPYSEPDAFVEEVAVVKRGRKRKATKKTVKEKRKKVKTKKKLQEQKIGSKKRAEDARSVSSADSRLFICDDLSDAGAGGDEVNASRVIKKEEEVKEKKKETARSKESEVLASKGILPVEYDHIEQQTQKRNGAPGFAPEALSDKPTCTECGKVFSSKKTYRYHLKNASPPRYSCPLVPGTPPTPPPKVPRCSERAEFPPGVLHKGQNRYPCPRCGKVYQWKSNLGRHMRTHKARDSGELHCALCDKRFASVATFRQHLRVSRRHVAESEFSFMCNECGKRFVNKTRLRDHVDWEHLHKIKFRCQLCNKPFKCHTSLYVHMQNVHRNKQKENLCHICGKSYQNAAKLKYHIVAMHTSETPYQCPQCAAAFGWYSSLYRHVREVHYKMKLQPKKMRKTKRPASPPPPPLHPHSAPPPPLHPLV